MAEEELLFFCKKKKKTDYHVKFYKESKSVLSLLLLKESETSMKNEIWWRYTF